MIATRAAYLGYVLACQCANRPVLDPVQGLALVVEGASDSVAVGPRRTVALEP